MFRIKQDIFFGEVPLMTEEGTFVISGCERIIISQIIRSPGIYLEKNLVQVEKLITLQLLFQIKDLGRKLF